MNMPLQVTSKINIMLLEFRAFEKNIPLIYTYMEIQ